MKGSHDRDQSVERLLRQSFKPPEQGVTDSCLDAETLAAWVDGGLSVAALEIAQSHVADCARCQSLVGALVRSDVMVPQPEPTPRRWLAWLVPLAAAAAALAVWIAVPRDTGAPASKATDIQRQAPGEKAPEPGSIDKLQAPANAKEEQATRAKKGPASRDQAQTFELRKDVGRLDADRLKQESGPSGQITPATADDKVRSAPAVAAPPAAFAARESVQARPANALAKTAAVGIEIVSPDPAVRWRIAGSVVEHSDNGGSRWDPVFTSGAAELTAGVAPSTSVCWVVGRGGLVLLSTDGRGFSSVPFPEMTDLSAVRATDARSASVSTLDGRIFNTTDSGVTWVRR